MPALLVLPTLAGLVVQPTLSRRDALSATVAAATSSTVLALPHRAAAASLDSVYDTRPLDQEPVVDPRKFTKLDSGVRYADLKVGSGPEVAASGSRVSLQWVLRRSNVHSRWD